MNNQRVFPKLKYSQAPGNPGNPVTSDLLTTSFYNVTKTDTVRRRKPVGIALYTQATPFACGVQERIDPIARFYRSDGTFYEANAVGSVGALGSGSEFPSLSEEALFSRVRSEVRGNYFNLANMMGEYRQTASTFVNVAQTVVRSVRAVRRLDPRGFLDPRVRTWDREAANRWLQWQYGIKPLVGDLQEAAKLLKQGLNSRPLVIPINVGIGVRHYIAPRRFTANGYTYTLTIVGRNQRRFQGIAVLKTDHLLTAASQLGLTNPISLVWELTPYSFVVDWFINFGEVLESLDNALIINQIIGCSSSKTAYARYMDFYGQSGYYSNVQKGRTPKSVNLIPPLRWRPSLSATRVTSALALLRQTINIRH